MLLAALFISGHCAACSVQNDEVDIRLQTELCLGVWQAGSESFGGSGTG